jgi:polyhydroxybutyrate depolymerase
MYLLHIPKSYNKAKWAPLVLAFHGGMGSAQSLKNGYDIVRKSDKEGFIVAFPNGTSRLKSGLFATWNAGNCCGFAMDSEADDVAFVKKVVDTIKKDYKVGKVFAMGMSNGGMFSYRLACDIPEYFDGIWAVAGTDNTITCTPKESTPIMHIHALNDDHVLYYGGKGPGSKDNHEPEFIGVPETIEKWNEINQCSITPTRVETGSGFTCNVYRNCQTWSPVKLCTTETGWHSWPGNPDRGNSRGGDKEPPSQAINATDELWNFFKLIK